ncbi:MAG: ATP-binding cassette domain-containing protein [Methylobacter sp.]|uniref:ATP-binding cassette domain-containing protein n=1 Tax=Candidatus Methylobacter titanis TaxID=3053457 RepID=A0AA43Q3J5_9GAMM|nr:ATP-binding cassette domain-containing protein [Candidatus Methylobacter titanis]
MLQQQAIEFRSSFTRTRTALNLMVGQEYVAGSGDNNEIILQGQDVLGQHAKLTLSPEGLFVMPIKQSPISVNGHAISESTLLDDGDWLSLGSCLFQINFPDHPHTFAQSASPPSRLQPQSGILIIGRLSECDLEIASPLVSREHAKLYCGPVGVEIEDLHSTNGTFVNGRRLSGRVHLRQGDRVAIASFAFTFTGEALEPIDTSGRVCVEVRGLYKEVIDRSTKQTRRLLDDISLVIEPGEFVVIFGTSGSGKSTLLDALNGRRPGTGGKVLYNGTDLYASFDAFRATIGYVPQQDIVHRKITIQHALEYTAHLRLPPDTSDEEINDYIGKVLDKVGLAEKSTQAIDTPAPLSGGQLKRVSLAVELVSNPNILFLDEVTSGLDAGTDKRMMRLFADLAADQKTVICVTHTLENIDVCHQVILLHKGKLVYFGPPKEAAGHFGVQRLSDVYELLESSLGNIWEENFRQSAYYRTYVLDRLSSHDPNNSTTHNLTELNTVKNHIRWMDWRQTSTLMRRYLDLIVSDQKNLLILLLQAPLIAVVIGLVFDTNGLPAQRAAAESQIFFILVLSSIWFGTLNSARELVKELPVYLRERSVNLGIMPYLISKLLPLAVLCLIQCILLMGIVSLLVALPGSYILRVAALFAVGMAATCMGLAVSAFVDSNDKAVAIAPILLIPQVVLSNAVVRLGDVGLWVAKSSMVSFWALDAMKTTLSSESRSVRDMTGQLIVSVSDTYGADLAMVAVLGCVFLVIAVLGLKLKDQRK